MLRIGLTGGIGSGKTTVAHIFSTLGIPVYYADDAAKRLYAEHEGLRQSMITHFGEESYKDGNLNRPYIASQVFGNNENLSLLNSLVHPLTIADAKAWMDLQQAPYILKEAAVLFESGADQDLDMVIGVSCPEPLRIRRAMERDHVEEAEIRKRMARQMDEAEKMSKCDFVIINDEEQLLIPQVIALHNKLIGPDEPL
jgi:dephospho-CoA kinase